MQEVNTLCKTINYQFNHSELLTLALSHRSVGKENNERLEFLGDAIVNLIIASALFDKEQAASEGDLSRMRASLVKGDTLAEIAKEFNLGNYLKLGPGELKTGGHKRESILAGTLEALIGAIYLDSNFEICRSIVLAWFEHRLKQTETAHIAKDPKTQLQEYLQALKIPVPEYKMLSATGAAHQQTFQVECIIESLGKRVTERGLSRRKAEQNAAEAMMKELKHGH